MVWILQAVGFDHLVEQRVLQQQKQQQGVQMLAELEPPPSHRLLF